MKEKKCPLKFQECEPTCEWFDEKYKVCVVVAMFKGFFKLLKGFYPSLRDKEEKAKQD